MFSQRYVCLMRRGHRLDQEGLSLDDFSSADHLAVISAGTGHGHVDELLERNGVDIKGIGSVYVSHAHADHITSAGRLAEHTGART